VAIVDCEWIVLFRHPCFVQQRARYVETDDTRTASRELAAHPAVPTRKIEYGKDRRAAR
jgi:hypothetical protein